MREFFLQCSLWGSGGKRRMGVLQWLAPPGFFFFNLSDSSTRSLQQFVSYSSGFSTQHWFLWRLLLMGFCSAKLWFSVFVYWCLQFGGQQFALSEKALAPHSSTLAWKIPWTEEPGGLQSMESWRVGHDWVTSLSLFTFMHWRRKWQPTPVFLPGESQGGGEPGGLPSMGSHRVGHDWSDLAAAVAVCPVISLRRRI